jgi:hypothetical protein
MLIPEKERPTYVPCTQCGAGSGSWCRNGFGKARFPVHKKRLKAFRAWQEMQTTKEK